MFRMRRLMDGRRFVAIVDESRYYMDCIAGVIEDFALTGRKKELVLVLAAQKPGHILISRPAARSWPRWRPASCSLIRERHGPNTAPKAWAARPPSSVT